MLSARIALASSRREGIGDSLRICKWTTATRALPGTLKAVNCLEIHGPGQDSRKRRHTPAPTAISPPSPFTTVEILSEHDRLGGVLRQTCNQWRSENLPFVAYWTLATYTRRLVRRPRHRVGKVTRCVSFGLPELDDLHHQVSPSCSVAKNNQLFSSADAQQTSGFRKKAAGRTPPLRLISNSAAVFAEPAGLETHSCIQTIRGSGIEVRAPDTPGRSRASCTHFSLDGGR